MPVTLSMKPAFRALGLIMQAAVTKRIGSRLEAPLKDQVITRANASIKFIVDDWCGTPNHAWIPPQPFPGPRKAAVNLATLLATVAMTKVQDVELRDDLLQIASQITETAYKAGV